MSDDVVRLIRITDELHGVAESRALWRETLRFNHASPRFFVDDEYPAVNELDSARAKRAIRQALALRPSTPNGAA